MLTLYHPPWTVSSSWCTSGFSSSFRFLAFFFSFFAFFLAFFAKRSSSPFSFKAPDRTLNSDILKQFMVFKLQEVEKKNRHFWTFRKIIEIKKINSMAGNWKFEFFDQPLFALSIDSILVKDVKTFASNKYELSLLNTKQNAKAWIIAISYGPYIGIWVHSFPYDHRIISYR